MEQGRASTGETGGAVSSPTWLPTAQRGQRRPLGPHPAHEAFRSAANESRALRTSMSLKQTGRSTYGNAQGSWEVQVKQLGLPGASRGRRVHTVSTETRREAACHLRAAGALLGGQRAGAWDRWAPRPVRRPASAVGTQEHASSLTRPRGAVPAPGRPCRWLGIPAGCQGPRTVLQEWVEVEVQ